MIRKSLGKRPHIDEVVELRLGERYSLGCVGSIEADDERDPPRA